MICDGDAQKLDEAILLGDRGLFRCAGRRSDRKARSGNDEVPCARHVRRQRRQRFRSFRLSLLVGLQDGEETSKDFHGRPMQLSLVIAKTKIQEELSIKILVDAV